MVGRAHERTHTRTRKSDPYCAPNAPPGLRPFGATPSNRDVHQARSWKLAPAGQLTMVGPPW